MTETNKTLIYAVAALVLVALSWLLAPSQITPEAFLDQGELFFPEFTDPNEATTLEVIEYDESTGAARPFKVTFQNGLWTIPSHHNYPADAADRLARTAAGVIDIRKDDFRTDNVAEHEACGVIDPLDESSAGLSGRGKRVTLKAADGSVLADFIVGKEVLSHQGFRFIRVPGQNRVYSSRVNLELTTRFEDWINRDLLATSPDNMVRITFKDYSINERTLSVEQRETFSLSKRDDEWTTSKLASSKMIDTTEMKSLLRTLDELAVVGVRPKPAGLSGSLKAGDDAVSRSDQVSLQSKGYYLTKDGQLMSNEGELQILARDGVKYTLRFGEVLFGTGLAVSAGTAGAGDEQSGQENRYLFVTAEFDSSPFGNRPAGPSDESFLSKPDSTWTDSDRENKRKKDEFDNWNRQVEAGRRLAESLNNRFADWYYVISGSDFNKLDLGRDDLVTDRE